MNTALEVEDFFKSRSVVFRDWVYVRTSDPFTRKEDGITIPGLCAHFFETNVEGIIYSAGAFTWHDSPAFIAWGKKSDAACGIHAVFHEGQWSENIAGCPDLTLKRDAYGSILGFTINVVDRAVTFIH